MLYRASFLSTALALAPEKPHQKVHLETHAHKHKTKRILDGYEDNYDSPSGYEDPGYDGPNPPWDPSQGGDWYPGGYDGQYTDGRGGVYPPGVAREPMPGSFCGHEEEFVGYAKGYTALEQLTSAALLTQHNVPNFYERRFLVMDDNTNALSVVQFTDKWSVMNHDHPILQCAADDSRGHSCLPKPNGQFRTVVSNPDIDGSFYSVGVDASNPESAVTFNHLRLKHVCALHKTRKTCLATESTGDALMSMKSSFIELADEKPAPHKITKSRKLKKADGDTDLAEIQPAEGEEAAPEQPPADQNSDPDYKIALDTEDDDSCCAWTNADGLKCSKLDGNGCGLGNPCPSDGYCPEKLNKYTQPNQKCMAKDSVSNPTCKAPAYYVKHTHSANIANTDFYKESWSSLNAGEEQPSGNLAFGNEASLTIQGSAVVNSCGGDSNPYSQQFFFALCGKQCGLCDGQTGVCSNKKWQDVNECWEIDQAKADKGEFAVQPCEGWVPAVGSTAENANVGSTARLMVMTQTGLCEGPSCALTVVGNLDITGLPAGLNDFSGVHFCPHKNQLTLLSKSGKAIWTAKIAQGWQENDKGGCFWPHDKNGKWNAEVASTGYLTPLPPNICSAMSVIPSSCYDHELYDFVGTRYQNAAKPKYWVETFVVANAPMANKGPNDQCYNCTSGLVVMDYAGNTVNQLSATSATNGNTVCSSEDGNKDACDAVDVNVNKITKQFCNFCDADASFPGDVCENSPNGRCNVACNQMQCLSESGTPGGHHHEGGGGKGGPNNAAGVAISGLLFVAMAMVTMF